MKQAASENTSTMTNIQNIYDRYRWLLSDIRFWLILLFILRLIGIANAPLEIGHNWRQSLTAMIARNFFENGANLWYPQIDLAGEKTGIIGSEFPVFNYLIYLIAKIFGYQHWYGRLINLVVTTIGTYYFYKTIKALTYERVAYFATLLLTVSIWFGFSRKIMPDTFSVALMLIGLYHAHRYLTVPNAARSLLWFLLWCTAGMLVKIPALSLLSVLSIALFVPSIPYRKIISCYAASTVSFAVVCLWYFYWVPYLVDTYGYQLYFPRSFLVGLQEVLRLWPQFLEKFYFAAFSSFVGFACFLGGIYLLSKHRAQWRHHLFGIGVVTVVFFIFVIKTGLVFPLHSYYIIPYVPVMAAIAGYFLAQLSPRLATWLMVIVAIEAIANHQNDFFVKDSERYKLTLESIVERHIPSCDLIVINGGPSPQDIYFSHRKGWTSRSDELAAIGYLDSLHTLGATHLIWDKKQGNLPIFDYSPVYENSHYVIQKIMP